MNEDRIEQALTRHFARDTEDGLRVIAKLTGPLPQQKRPTLWPQLLLDRQFTPAWPRMAALAGCAALGFVVGSATINRVIAHDAFGARSDVTQFVFEPEPLTGLRP